MIAVLRRSSRRWLAPYDPDDTAVLDRLQSPRAAHWFGTDELGRDVFSRIVFGARYSLLIGALTVAGLGDLPASLLGLVAGFFRRLDAPLMRVVDAMMSFPDILLAIALVAILGRVADQRDARAGARLHAARGAGGARLDAGGARAAVRRGGARAGRVAPGASCCVHILHNI